MFQPLTGIDLIDCARANAQEGLKTVTQLCGYGTDLEGFHHALTEAGHHMGMDIESLDSLLVNADSINRTRKIEVAPDTLNSESDQNRGKPRYTVCKSTYT